MLLQLFEQKWCRKKMPSSPEKSTKLKFFLINNERKSIIELVAILKSCSQLFLYKLNVKVSLLP